MTLDRLMQESSDTPTRVWAHMSAASAVQSARGHVCSIVSGCVRTSA